MKDPLDRDELAQAAYWGYDPFDDDLEEDEAEDFDEDDHSTYPPDWPDDGPYYIDFGDDE